MSSLFPARFIGAEGFADHALERDVFFDGKLAAVVVFGRNVQDTAVHAGNLDAHVAEICGNSYEFARERAALCAVSARAKGRCFGKDQRSEEHTSELQSRFDL